MATLESKVVARYRDAYTVARTIIAVGGVVKFLGVLGGVVAILAGVVLGTNGGHSTTFNLDSLIGMGVGLVGLLVGIGLYVAGILVAAQGQMLEATLDTAVHGSPFINDAQRTYAMGLQSPDAGTSHANDGAAQRVPAVRPVLPNALVEAYQHWERQPSDVNLVRFVNLLSAEVSRPDSGRTQAGVRAAFPKACGNDDFESVIARMVN